MPRQLSSLQGYDPGTWTASADASKERRKVHARRTGAAGTPVEAAPPQTGAVSAATGNGSLFQGVSFMAPTTTEASAPVPAANPFAGIALTAASSNPFAGVQLTAPSAATEPAKVEENKVNC
jgi:hypothetical protein